MISFAYLSAFISYFAFFIIVSIYFYRTTTTSQAFMLGNRNINYWVTAIAAQASDMSDWLLMAYPGLIYGLGLFNAWVAIGLVIFMYLNWTFVAPRLRQATEHYNALTLASFFEKRFNDRHGSLRLLTVFFTVFFLTFYIAAELIGLGRLFQTTFNIPYHAGIIISLGLIIFNILIGGFTAVAWTDLFRGLFLLVTLIVVPLHVCNYQGGVTYCMKSLSLNEFFNALFPDYSFATLSSILLLATGWGLGYFGMPHILINFMGIKQPEKINRAKYIGVSWQIFVLSAATIIGLLGQQFFTTPLHNRELVFIELVKQLFTPFLAGLILCAVLAATMSVMTAQILVTASTVSQDLIKSYFKNINNDISVIITRWCVIIIPCFAYIISYYSKSTINDLVAYAWSGLGLTFSPLVICSLYLKNITVYGALAGLLFGGLLGILWPYLQFQFLPLLPGFFISIIIIVIISHIYKSTE